MLASIQSFGSRLIWRFLALGALGVAFIHATPPAIADEAPAAKPAPAAAGEAKFDKPFLYAIKGEKKHSFILGTIHLPDSRLAEFPDVLNRVLDSVDGLRTELPMDAATLMGLSAKLVRTDGKTLTEALGPDLARRANAFLEKRGASLAPLDNIQTLLASMQIGLAELPPQQVVPLDMTVFQRGAEAGIDVGGLETVDEQMGLLTGLTEEKQVHLFAKGMDLLEKAERDGAPYMKRLMDGYLSGDHDQLMKTMDEGMDKNDPIQADFYTKLLADRNVTMAERIEKLLKDNPDKSYLFAIGAGHLKGEKGVLDLLEKQGMKVKRLQPEDAAKIKPRAKSQ